MAAAAGGVVVGVVLDRLGKYVLRSLHRGLTQADSELSASLWINEEPSQHGIGIYLLGSAGGNWLSRDERVKRGWPDVGPPSNIFALPARQPAVFQAEICCHPRTFGEQAGLFAYAGPGSWVKFVIEGAGEGSWMLVLASQQDFAPFLTGQMQLPDFSDRITLRMTVADSGCSVVAHWRRSCEDQWVPMMRGDAWLQESEPRCSSQEKDFHGMDILALDDPRSNTPAKCLLPGGWRAVLCTEQWKKQEGAGVAFTNIQYE